VYEQKQHSALKVTTVHDVVGFVITHISSGVAMAKLLPPVHRQM
jgi:hypothetical protein